VFTFNCVNLSDEKCTYKDMKETGEFSKNLFISCRPTKTYYSVSRKNRENFENSFEFNLKVRYQMKNCIHAVFLNRLFYTNKSYQYTQQTNILSTFS
jgi:hypothetical protein